MLNQWLCILFQSATGYVFGLALDHMLEVHEMKLPQWGRALLWFTIYFVMAFCNVFYKNVFGSLRLILWMLFALYTIFAWYTGAIWKRFAAVGLLYFAVIVAEIMISVFYAMGVPEILVGDYTSMEMMLGTFAATLMGVAMIYLVAFLWMRISKSVYILRRSWVFVVLLVGLIIPIMFLFLKDDKGSFALHMSGQMFVLLSFVYGMALVILAFNQSDKEHIQKELVEMTYQTRLEQQHYRHIEEKREEVAKLRHDYNNLLSSSLGLLREGRHDEAEELLASLLTRVQSTKEITYCALPVVNAILSEKQQECEREGIALSVDLPIPPTVTVAPIDLCSVFGNILDNAIRACSQLPPETARTILLTAAMQGDYLTIRCDNPTLAKDEPREGGGYGLKILADIAARYGGALKTVRENGQFSIRVVLMNVM